MTQAQAQIRRTSMSDQAAEVLLERIRGGEWELGSKLPGETTLAAQLGVGRTTIREAIRHLAGRGVLSARQGSGVFVTALEVREDWDRVLARSDILAVIEARVAIEAEAAGLAAARRTPAELRAIHRALEFRKQRQSDIEEHVDADTAFHRTIVAAAHNPILLELFDGFTPRLRQAMIDMLRIRAEYGGDADQQAHVELADAIATGDARDAAERSRAHLSALAEELS